MRDWCSPAIGARAWAYLALSRGFEHVDATRAMSGNLLKPAAALLAWFWLGEPLTWESCSRGADSGRAYGVFVWDRNRRPRPSTSG